MFKQTATKQQHYEAACALFAARYSIADIARESGIGEQMLRNKLNPDQPHQLTARDLVAIYQVTGDDILFDGLLFDCGLNAVRLPGQPRLRQRPAPSRHSTPAPRSWASLPSHHHSRR